MLVEKVQLGIHSNTGKKRPLYQQISSSIVVSIPACHAGDRGSIPRSREIFCTFWKRFLISLRFRMDTVDMLDILAIRYTFRLLCFVAQQLADN